MHDAVDPDGLILDPCVGQGSLLKPFQRAGYKTTGIDIEEQGYPETIIRDFISLTPGEIETPELVVANPPFNIDEKTKNLAAVHFGRRPLLPEVWLHKTVELWGPGVKLALFAPYGMRLNQTLNSRRWKSFLDGTYPAITSIISLPKDIYENVLFHSEILIFNINNLSGHYFYDG